MIRAGEAIAGRVDMRGLVDCVDHTRARHMEEECNLCHSDAAHTLEQIRAFNEQTVARLKNVMKNFVELGKQLLASSTVAGGRRPSPRILDCCTGTGGLAAAADATLLRNGDEAQRIVNTFGNEYAHFGQLLGAMGTFCRLRKWIDVQIARCALSSLDVKAAAAAGERAGEYMKAYENYAPVQPDAPLAPDAVLDPVWGVVDHGLWKRMAAADARVADCVSVLIAHEERVATRAANALRAEEEAQRTAKAAAARAEAAAREANRQRVVVPPTSRARSDG